MRTVYRVPCGAPQARSALCAARCPSWGYPAPQVREGEVRVRVRVRVGVGVGFGIGLGIGIGIGIGLGLGLGLGLGSALRGKLPVIGLPRPPGGGAKGEP